jgi:hypothetical protein
MGKCMAGDWIKLQKDTPDKPEILAMSSRLGIDSDAVVGKLVRIWSWFDTHTTSGNASCVTYSFLDRLAGVTGFAEQMALVGWLEQNGHDLKLSNFGYHNGDTAKTRALGKNRVEKSRSNAPSNANTVTNSLPEKRREENIKEYIDVCDKSQSPDKQATCPTEKIVQLYNQTLHELPSVKLMTDKRKKAISKFWRFVMTSKKSDGQPRAENSEQALDWIEAYFLRVLENDFLMGKTGRTGEHSKWQCDLDYLLTDKGMTQVIEKTRSTD